MPQGPHPKEEQLLGRPEPPFTIASRRSSVADGRSAADCVNTRLFPILLFFRFSTCTYTHVKERLNIFAKAHGSGLSLLGGGRVGDRKSIPSSGQRLLAVLGPLPTGCSQALSADGTQQGAQQQPRVTAGASSWPPVF